MQRLPNKIVLRNGVLIDGTGNLPRENITLIIENDTIAAIGLAKSIPIPAGARVIEVQDQVILPGFINAHIHQGYDEGNLRLWVQDGVTTVRDLILLTDQINPFAFKARVNQKPEYSRLVTAGFMISAPNGYPFPFASPPFLPVVNQVEAESQVDRLINEGADVIKIMVESGAFFGQEIPTLGVLEIRAVVQAAQRRGSLVSAHVTSVADLKKALDGKVDDIAHLTGDRIPDELIAHMVENRIYMEPTLELWKEAERVWGLKSAAQINLKNYVAAGGLVALGTDYAGHPEFSFDIGIPMREIQWMQEAGMTPMQIITACTQNAAHVSNLANSTGTLAIGKKADILVVGGNPLADLGVLKEDKMVIHHGTVIREFCQ
ncbi:MAG TPA: amidohydrolase family protein [Bacillota bacterium]|nr:amidohydrolase family protein [Bacillota bacterium]